MGKGGQILLSGSVWNAVRADIGNTVVTTHAGEIKLKGMDNEEEIMQILPLALSKRKFPPLKVQGSRKGDEGVIEWIQTYGVIRS